PPGRAVPTPAPNRPGARNGQTQLAIIPGAALAEKSQAVGAGRAGARGGHTDRTPSATIVCHTTTGNSSPVQPAQFARPAPPSAPDSRSAKPARREALLAPRESPANSAAAPRPAGALDPFRRGIL